MVFLADTEYNTWANLWNWYYHIGSTDQTYRKESSVIFSLVSG